MKNATEILNDSRFMHNGTLFFTETQINLEQDIERVKGSLQIFSMFFNNYENKFLSLAYNLHNNVTLENLENYPAFSVIIVKNTAFNSVPLTLILLYRSNRQSSTDFY